MKKRKPTSKELGPDDAPYLTRAKFRELLASGKMQINENRGNWVKVVRARVEMSQAEFAAAFNLNLRTVQDWEQGRYKPDQIAMNYLRLILQAPGVVRKVLKKAA